ncbi:biopolymer transport protein ExbD [Rhodobacter viridis]|uniref:Biopolymer transport protein ExbD n=1 Tax=Rhodobacter viridis TaxID=1054202 RepID=A0A318UC73_9RHOB|nr:biopolymer transporter ExbD [Rhodobacter viridis]PYF09884.1 biopolymer transport protein ExbD [Rhodobacter viridis]
MRPLPRPQKRVRMDISFAVVNVVLLLIFFFLVTGRLMNPVDPEIELAETSELPLDALPSPLLVITAEGGWQLDGRDLAPELLGVAIGELAQPPVLHVLVNRHADATLLTGVLARPELAGVRVRLVTLRARKGAP